MSNDDSRSIPAQSSSGEFRVTRRSLLQVSVGAMSILAVPGLSLAALCPSSRTPRQTRGPYFPYDHVVSYPIREGQSQGQPLIEVNDNDLTQIKGKQGTAQGPVIFFQGQILQQSSPLADSKIDSCQPLVDVTIFLWQANFSGRYNHYQDDEAPPRFQHPKTGVTIERVHDEYFQYWGKATTDPNGKFQFKTILPGFYPASDNWFRPPHLHFSIRAKGHPEFVTQTYFSGAELPDIDLIHELNAKDKILRDSRIAPEQQSQVVVEYQKSSSGKLADGFVGGCRFLIP